LQTPIMRPMPHPIHPSAATQSSVRRMPLYEDEPSEVHLAAAWSLTAQYDLAWRHARPRRNRVCVLHRQSAPSRKLGRGLCQQKASTSNGRELHQVGSQYQSTASRCQMWEARRCGCVAFSVIAQPPNLLYAQP
jgi:hypothetical protein